MHPEESGWKRQKDYNKQKPGVVLRHPGFLYSEFQTFRALLQYCAEKLDTAGDIASTAIANIL